MSSSTFCVPVLDLWLIFDPLRGVTALVNRSAVEELKSGTGSTGQSLHELAVMLDDAPDDEPRAREGPVDPLFIGLLPTLSCNMRCRYCDFGAATAGEAQMEPSIAVAAIDWMAQHRQNTGDRTLDVHFFGGEPMQAFEVVEVAVHYARMVAARTDLIAVFEIATNGAFSAEKARWLGDYVDAVVLSLDGAKQAHDVHRPMLDGSSSFPMVYDTARTLSCSDATLCVRSCVSDCTLPDLEQNVSWLIDELRPNVIDIETLRPTAESKAAGLTVPDPWEFAKAFIHAGRAARERGTKLVYASAELTAPRATFCPVGQDALIVFPDGRLSTCYLPAQKWRKRGLDMDAGSITNSRVQLDWPSIEGVRRMVSQKPRCESCFCQWTCAGGCHVNETWPGCPDSYTDFCIQTRIITACQLLDSLGLLDVTDRLLDDREALGALAVSECDQLEEGAGMNV